MGGRAHRVLAGRGWTLAAAGLLAAVVLVKTAVQLQAGPLWDSYAFLVNAASMAGEGIGYEEPARPPMMSVLTAPLLLVGGLWEGSVQIVDALLTLAGGFFFFLLVRRRLGRAFGLLGAVCLLVLPPVWTWIGVGYSDFAAVSFALAALLALIRSDERPGFYLIAFPLFTAMVLTRFTALLLLMPLGLWVLLRVRLFRHGRYVLGGVALGLAAYLPAGWYYLGRFNDFLYPFQIALEIAQSHLTVGGGATVEPGSAPGPLLVAGVLMTGLGLVGFAAAAWPARPAPGTRPPIWRLRTLGALLVACGAAALGGGLVARQMAVAGTVFISLLAFAPRDGDGRIRAHAVLDGVFLLWLLALGDWFIHDPIKVPRYVIGFSPPLIYLTLVGFDHLRDVGTAFVASKRPKLVFRGTLGNRLRLAPYGLAAVFALACLAYDVGTVSATRDEAGSAARRAALWLSELDPAVGQKVVYSDAWPYTSWYLRSEAKPIPNPESPTAVLHELDKLGAEYYLTFGKNTLEPHFTALADAPSMQILARSRPVDSSRPRVMYLGDAWQNYLEGLLGLGVYLHSDLGVQGWDRSAFLDAYPAETLRKMDAVAAYAFRWRDRGRAETELEEYVRSGGVLIIDASGNFASAGHQLDGSVLWGVAVSRQGVRAQQVVSVSPALVERHPELRGHASLGVESEDGSPWFGATYRPLSSVSEWEVLAAVGDQTVAAVQPLGEGRIYWLGLNLAWHAFYERNDDAALFVRAVFADALGLAESPADAVFAGRDEGEGLQ